MDTIKRDATGDRSARFAKVRARARRLRLPPPGSNRAGVAAADRTRFDRFDIGLTIGLLVDAFFVIAVVVREDMPASALLFLGPLMVFVAVPQLAMVTVVGIFVAGVSGMWRVAAGLLVCQVLAALMGFAWLMALGGFGGFGIPMG